MYGLLLEGVAVFIRRTYGDDAWSSICQAANVEENQEDFSIHNVYPERALPRLVEIASAQLKVPKEEMLQKFGASFVTFVDNYGYDRILRVLGRHFRDFLNGLDNLHEYLRFSYPKIKPPSFFVEKETAHGLVLHYRSRRRYNGFVHYVCGQLKAVARKYYRKTVHIEVLSNTVVGSQVHVVFDVQFDNDEFVRLSTVPSSSFLLDRNMLKINSKLFFQLFPFHIVFDSELIIRHVGSGLHAVKPDMLGYDITHVFSLSKPVIDFTWDQLLIHVEHVSRKLAAFYLGESFTQEETSSGDGSHKGSSAGRGGFSERNSISESDYFSVSSEERDGDDMEDSKEGVRLHLKGQMKLLPKLDCFVFLGTLVMSDLAVLFKAGLYLNDLSMHDSSRDLLLAGSQQSAELKLALDQEQQKSQILEQSMKRLEEARHRAAELLHQMIPPQIAEQLRNGVNAEDTWQVFSSVSISFSDMYNFVVICETITPLEVVSLLNSMYVAFDQLLEKHQVYKVETVKDSYMIVAGAPTPDVHHASNICDMGLDMLADIQDVINPATGKHIEIRIGVHSGTIVAGVVGFRTPRFCLFGDPVNTASRMVSSGEPMKIHVSETTASHLIKEGCYNVAERGTVEIKGKGSMKTYWVLGKRKVSR